MAALTDAMAAAGFGALLLLAALCAGQRRAEPVFQPSFIHMSGLRVNSFFLGDSSGVTFSIILDAIDKETGNLLVPSCGGNERAGDWELSVTPGVGASKVTVTFTRNLQLCLPNATDCCTAPLCVVEILQVLACSGSMMLARLLIQAEIYANSSFTGSVSENMPVIPNQVFQPLGSCPCDLTDGACDVRCCCDPECTPDLKQLFNGSCFTGVFGGDVNPPFDQLCSTWTTEYTPDWFPLLCIQSSLSNTPFLGYFYDGSVSAPKVPPFKIPVLASPGKLFTGYRAGDPIMTEDDEYFTIPQSLTGQCVRNAPVAYLQDFDVKCLSEAASYKEGLPHDVRINSGTGDFIQQNVIYRTIPDRDKFITKSEGIPTVGMPLQSITFAEHYTFVWEGDNIEGVNVTVFLGNLYSGEMLTQRFTAEFVRLKSDNAAEVPYNPGYQVGSAVRAANMSASDTAGSLRIWQPADRGLCMSATHTPVLFGVDSFSGCLLEVNINEDCSLLRGRVTEKLNSLIQATHVGKRRNSNDSNLNDWVQIIRLDPSNPNITASPGDLKGICPGVPASLNIRIIFAAVGAVRGIPREEILAVQTSYSTITWQFQCGLPCENTASLLPITAAVEFIRVPARPPVPMSRFQINYTEFDCDRNDVCWPQLFYPLTRFYTGEPYSRCLAAGLALAFLAVLAAVMGSPCFAQVWENFSV
ncbi:tectonic-2 isoform X2 [Excalfactoria chinensis]|uniref:tectonic-2 isoform X2 n=1 Tax=Excalfactoria chinensis TaxID=46218 RepID=UPI003B3B23E8